MIRSAMSESCLLSMMERRSLAASFFSWRTSDIRLLASGLMSFSTMATMMSIPLLS